MISIYTATLKLRNQDARVVYVGITNNPVKRFKDHKYESRKKRKKTELGRLLRQYPRSLHFAVIGECFNEQDAENCERGLIVLFRCHLAHGGVNMTDGGNGIRPVNANRKKVKNSDDDLEMRV